MRYCVEVSDDGDIEIWKQEGPMEPWRYILNYGTRAELLDDVISYGVEKDVANAAVERLRKANENERIAV